MRYFLLLAVYLLAVATPSSRAEERKSLCEPCFCHGRTLRCDFRHNRTLSRIFDSKYSVPPPITGIYVHLADTTEFELHDGLFQQNRVNLFMIDGNNGSNQVELTANVLGGNLAGYPDFQILNVGHSFIRSEAFSNGESKLNIENNGYVILDRNCFKNMNMSCTLTNIEKLVINEKNYNPSTDRSSNTKLIIKSSNIDKINRIDSSINKIDFDNCRIDTIQSNALDVTNMNKISFNYCHIGTIETMAITSKLLSEDISFIGNQIGTIDSKAIMGSGTSTFTFRNNTVDNILEDGIMVNCVEATIEGNWFKQVGMRWLHMSHWEQISIRDNHFDNFTPIQLNVDDRKRTNCTFFSNTLKNPLPQSLNFNCEVRATSVDRECGCDDMKTYVPTLTEHDISSELYCQLRGRLSTCFKVKQMHMRRYANEVCGATRNVLRCPNGSNLERYKDDYYTREEREEMQKGFSYESVIVIVVGAVGVVLLSCLLIYCVRQCLKKKKSPAASCLSANDYNRLQQELKILSSGSNNQDTIKLIKKLINSKQTTERQCKERVLELCRQPIDNLSDNARRMLIEHLELKHSYYLPMPSAPIESNTEHIYDEPLLSNEYSSPSDQAAAMAEYAEPINTAIADEDDMPPAYEAAPQYATPIRSPAPPSQLQHQLPSTSAARHYQGLPDVLYTHQPGQSTASYATPVWRSTPNATPISGPPTVAIQPPDMPAQRHVRDLRQDLEAMPQFHPNQLTSARNQSQLQSRYPNSVHNIHNSSKRKRSFECLDGAASLAAMEHMDMRGATALPPDTNSDHSGGSVETVKIDDIEYADA